MLPWVRYDRRRKRYIRTVDRSLLGAAMRELAEMESSRWGRRMRALELSGDPMAMAQPNGAPSIHAGVLAGFGAFIPNADVQVFVPFATSQTQPAGTGGVDLQGSWQKPKGARLVYVENHAAGAGGGSGRKGSTTTVCCGGGGGGGGAVSFAFFLASDLPDEVLLLVFAGGAGGTAVSGTGTNGNSATFGNNEAYQAFGSSGPANNVLGPLIGAKVGSVGSGGTAASGSAGGGGGFGAYLGSGGGSANTSGTAGGNGVAASPTVAGATGGGAGGGLTSGNAHSAGGTGGASLLVNANPAGGAAGGTAGTRGLTPHDLYQSKAALNTGGHTTSQPAPGLSQLAVGSGGGGGGSANAGDAVSGGNGGNGIWGGGGGGGGAATDTTSPQSGAGGNGGDGYIIVLSW